MCHPAEGCRFRARCGLVTHACRVSVAIVVYAGASGLVLPPTSGADKETILGALGSLAAGGSTAGGQGIELAYKVAQENFDPKANNRVILATDGDFNVGISSLEELQKLIETIGIPAFPDDPRRVAITTATLGLAVWPTVQRH